MPQADWLKPEHWVWDQVRVGRIADFNKRFADKNKLDPSSGEGWGEDRLLRTVFVREIFYSKSLGIEIPPEGVQIEGAWFRDKLALPYGSLHTHLSLEVCRFDQGIDLSAQAIGGWLSLAGSFIADSADGSGAVNLTATKIDGSLNLYGTLGGPVIMNDLYVGKDLFMNGSKERTANFKDIDLSNAHIEGHLKLDGATVAGQLTMNGLHVGRHLSMQGNRELPARFATVDLGNADIDGQLALVGATVTEQLKMNDLRVGQSLFMRGTKEWPASFGVVDLTNSRIEGQLSLIGATIAGKLVMNGVQVGQNLMMQPSDDGQRCQLQNEVDLCYAKIAGGLYLNRAGFVGRLKLDYAEITRLEAVQICCAPGDNSLQASLKAVQVGESIDFTGSAVGGLDLSGSKIEGELRLAGAQWTKDAQLRLRDAHAAVLQEDGHWPKSLELNGFTYDRIGGTDAKELGRKAAHEYYIEGWLEHDPTYTPQPYEQLASVLRAAGEPVWASDILYASRKRAQQAAAEERVPLFGSRRLRIPTFRYLGMWLLDWTIGYGIGYRYFWCLLWIGVFAALGVGVLFFGALHGIDRSEYLVYSLVKLLPFATLREFKDVTLSPLATWYFYIHQLVGYVLAGFLAAGLAGLTQKS